MLPRYIILRMFGARGWIYYCIVYVERNALKSNVNTSKNQVADMLTSSGLSADLTLFQRLRKPESLGPLTEIRRNKCMLICTDCYMQQHQQRQAGVPVLQAKFPKM